MLDVTAYDREFWLGELFEEVSSHAAEDTRLRVGRVRRNRRGVPAGWYVCEDHYDYISRDVYGRLASRATAERAASERLGRRRAACATLLELASSSKGRTR